MKPERYIPMEALTPFISAFLIIESDSGAVNRVLPDSVPVMAFRYKGSVSVLDGTERSPLPFAVISGLRKTSRMICYAPHTANLLVLFREGGAATFLREPLHELFGQSPGLDTWMPRRELGRIEEQLSEAGTNADRIQLIQAFLLARLRPPQPDRLVGEAIRQIKAARGDINIRELTGTLSLSLDPFEKRFRRVTGTTPKQFSSIIRLRNLIDLHAGRESLTSMAYAAGYFDQAHFIKDFKSFTGQTPGHFFAHKDWW
jgi:AraC-like DNA-binding protein